MEEIILLFSFMGIGLNFISVMEGRREGNVSVKHTIKLHRA